MPTALKVMFVRHGEKPTIKHQAPYGVTPDGEQDWESLTVRGWLRAGALDMLFNPTDGAFVDPALATPKLIYASKPRDLGIAAPADDDGGSKSKRPLQTITPLAAKLGLAPNLDYGKGDEAALAKHVLKQSGAILIAWQHEAIPEIAQYLVGTNPPKAAIPAEWPGARFDVVWVFDPPPKGKSRWKFAQIPQRLLPGDSNSVIS